LQYTFDAIHENVTNAIIPINHKIAKGFHHISEKYHYESRLGGFITVRKWH